MKRIINTFVVSEASYFVTGSKEESVKLKIDYANNQYSVTIQSNVSDELRKQAEFIAQYLLKDKAQKNLVTRLQKKKIIP